MYPKSMLIATSENGTTTLKLVDYEFSEVKPISVYYDTDFRGDVVVTSEGGHSKVNKNAPQRVLTDAAKKKYVAF